MKANKNPRTHPYVSKRTGVFWDSYEPEELIFNFDGFADGIGFSIGKADIFSYGEK